MLSEGFQRTGQKYFTFVFKETWLYKEISENAIIILNINTWTEKKAICDHRCPPDSLWVSGLVVFSDTCASQRGQQQQQKKNGRQITFGMVLEQLSVSSLNGCLYQWFHSAWYWGGVGVEDEEVVLRRKRRRGGALSVAGIFFFSPFFPLVWEPAAAKKKKSVKDLHSWSPRVAGRRAALCLYSTVAARRVVTSRHCYSSGIVPLRK